MFELPTQPSCRVLLIADVCDMILLNQDDDNTDREDISDAESEDPAELTSLSDIEWDDVDSQQDVLHLY